MPNLAPHTAIILLAAGSGQRFGRDKMWVDVGGRPLVAWSLHTLLDVRPSALVLVGKRSESGDLSRFEALDDRIHACVQGGETRRASVLAGLAALPPETQRVLIHDAARPGVTAEIVLDVAQALKTHAAALPVLPLSDTIKQITETTCTTLDRSTLRAAQTPQGFQLKALQDALAEAGDATDEIQAMEAAGHMPALIPGSLRNQKITHGEDLTMLTPLLTPAPITITGLGFDVHRFCEGGEAEGRTLVLGGLKMRGERPLAGHSDADVLLHALCDAIYGALGEGDIGKHFPPSDMMWKDQDSTHFLAHALGRIAERGGALIHTDLTLICETPKLHPHEDAMRTRLLALTGLSPTRLGLKATTTERLGFTGRGEGIAAQALVTLHLPG